MTIQRTTYYFRHRLTTCIIRLLTKSYWTRWLLIDFNRLGIDFPYRGDWVIWLWPWAKNRTHKYISVCSEGQFNSLLEIREFWDEYENFVIKSTNVIDKDSQDNYSF